MAIPSHIRLVFVTPERAIAHEDVDEVVLPGENGDFGVLPGHAALLASLRPGPMWYRVGHEKHVSFVGGGFAEVVADRVSVLAPVAERAEDIDLARAEAAKRRAEDRLTKAPMEIDTERARIALARAISRLEISRFQASKAAKRSHS